MKTEIFDKLGITASLMCAVHCAAMPVLIVILPYIGLSLFLDSKFELFILLLSSLLATLSICFGFKKHNNKKLALMFSVGLLILLLGHFCHENNWTSNSYLISIIGGLIITMSHYFNSKLCSMCERCKVH